MHTNCQHINTPSANALCDSFRNPVLVAHGGSYIRSHMATELASSKMKAKMDRRYASAGTH